MLNYNIVDSIINNKSLYPCADDYNKKGIIKADLTTLGCAIFSMKKEAKNKVKNKIFEVSKGYLHVIGHTLFGSLNFYDKKTLIYILSKLAAFKREDGFIPERFYFSVHDYCKVVGMGQVGGKNRKLLRASLDRLKYTGFVLSQSERYDDITQNSTHLSFLETITNQSIESNTKYFIVDIPKWLRDDLEKNSLLTLNPNYFQMTNPFQSRLYEIARKYCGDKKSQKLYFPTVQMLLGTEDKNIRKLKYKLRLHGGLKTEDNPDGIFDYYIEIFSDHILIHNNNAVDYNQDEESEEDYNEELDCGTTVLKDIPKNSIPSNQTIENKPDKPRESMDLDTFIEQTPIGMTFFNQLKILGKNYQIIPNDIVKNKERWIERGYNDIYSVKRETPPRFDKGDKDETPSHVSVISDKTTQLVREAELFTNLETIVFQHKMNTDNPKPVPLPDFIHCFYEMFKQAGSAGAAIKNMMFTIKGIECNSDDEDTKNKLYNMYRIGMKNS